MNKPNIIQFICYSPRIYSGFDNFQVSLSRELYEKSYHNIVAYSDTINIPKLEKDISDNNGIYFELFTNFSSYFDVAPTGIRKIRKIPTP